MASLYAAAVRNVRFCPSPFFAAADREAAAANRRMVARCATRMTLQTLDESTQNCGGDHSDRVHSSILALKMLSTKTVQNNRGTLYRVLRRSIDSSLAASSAPLRPWHAVPRTIRVTDGAARPLGRRLVEGTALWFDLLLSFTRAPQRQLMAAGPVCSMENGVIPHLLGYMRPVALTSSTSAPVPARCMGAARCREEDVARLRKAGFRVAAHGRHALRGHFPP